MSEDNLSKAELALIDRIVGAVGLAKFRNTLWQKVQQAFGFSFHGTNIEYGFARATPDERALAYLNDRIFILSDKTQAKLVGDLRWELLDGMKNAESIDAIRRRLDGIFKGNAVNTERIARTETLNAMNAGRQNAYEVSEVVHYKMWKAAMKNPRTAADSKRLNGQIQEVGNPFVDPKTGDATMHPPNRPFCRCTTIPMRKLPENVVHKGGQMYAADEMVGKIEIDMGSLNKTEKRVWVKPTTKRKGHYRKIKDAKKVEEKLGINRIKSIIPNVHLEGATQDQLNSIADGLEETIGKFSNVEVNTIEWLTPDDRDMYGLVDAAYVPKTKSGLSERIVLNKDLILDLSSWADKTNKKFNSRKDINIEYCDDMIAMHTKFGDTEQVVKYEEKLKSVKACSRLFVMQSVSDKIKGLLSHECYHAIDVQLKGREIFSDQLVKMGVTDKDKMQVSDYAASDDRELWAEVGSAISFGIKIPDTIKRAFDSTMETIR